MARSTYFDLGRSADACPGSESGYAQRFQCGNIVKRRIWTRMRVNGSGATGFRAAEYLRNCTWCGSELRTRHPGAKRTSSRRYWRRAESVVIKQIGCQGDTTQ